MGSNTWLAPKIVMLFVASGLPACVGLESGIDYPDLPGDIGPQLLTPENQKDPPIALNRFLPTLAGWFGLQISTAGISHAELMIFGSLIVWFLIVEPHGLARLWSTAKQKLRLWPFPH